MEDVDLTGVTVGLFITDLLFILFVLSMFSLSVLFFFQAKKRSGFILLGAGVVALIVFIVILKLFFA